jgi:hypothetical protein
VLSLAVLGQTSALIIGAIAARSFVVPADTYWNALLITGPISIGIGAWAVKYHLICIDEHGILFKFTRYGIPKKMEVQFCDVKGAVYFPGILSLDGRPRPLIEFSLRSGESFWIPFSIYSKTTIEDIQNALISRGVNMDTSK